MDKTKKTIMVVDDEEDIRKTAEMLLKHNGYNVLTAVDGDNCLKKLPKAKVDLILLDIMMPGMPVEQVISKIKNTKIILVSVVRKGEADREKLLLSGNVVGYVEKPFNINTLLNEVKKAVMQ